MKQAPAAKQLASFLAKFSPEVAAVARQAITLLRRQLPAALVHRLSGPAAGPWMVPSAVRWLGRELQPSWAVLELGSGSSTAWLARRVSRVISFEDDRAWYRQVRRDLGEDGLRNSEVRFCPIDDLPGVLASFESESIDVAIVDCNESEEVDRIDCLVAVRDLVRPGGLLILDDSDRIGYESQGQHLQGWEARRFIGLKPYPLMAVETAVYRRPGSADLAG